MMKYPIGMQSFEQIIKGGFVYVDKTDLMWKLAQNHVCFLGRPRRFGKSLLVCIFETPKDIYIFEFKLDGSAEEALLQIEEKGYAREYASDSRKIHQIGVNFSSEKGTIDEWKTK